MISSKNENGKIFGYARVSSSTQNIETQLLQLKNSGYIFDEIYEEIGSGAKDVERPKFVQLEKTLRKGDWLVVTGLDRLGRTTRGLYSLLEELEEEGVTLISLREGYNFSTPSGRLIFNLLSSLAEYERTLLLERQKLGIERAKGEGKYKGRKRTPLPEESYFVECFEKYEGSTRRNKYTLKNFHEDMNKLFKNKKNGRKGTVEIQVSKSTLNKWIRLYRLGTLYPTQKKREMITDG